MNFIISQKCSCPYCGEIIELLIDNSQLNESEAEQQYIEDCQVCCRPIIVKVSIDENGNSQVILHDENET